MKYFARMYAFYRFLLRVIIVGKNKRLNLFFSYLVKRRIERHVKAMLVEILIIVIMIIVCFT